MHIRSLCLSLAFLSIPIASVNACVSSSDTFRLLLDKAPKRLHGAGFMGQIEVTQKTQLENGAFVVIANLLKSETHIDYEGQNILFLYDQTSCGPDTYVGHKGYLIGNFMTIDAGLFISTLVVDPYEIRGVGEEELLTRKQMQETLRTFSTNWGIREVFTGEEVIPLWKFYFEDFDIESDT